MPSELEITGQKINKVKEGIAAARHVLNKSVLPSDSFGPAVVLSDEGIEAGKSLPALVNELIDLLALREFNKLGSIPCELFQSQKKAAEEERRLKPDFRFWRMYQCGSFRHWFTKPKQEIIEKTNSFIDSYNVNNPMFPLWKIDGTEWEKYRAR